METSIAPVCANSEPPSFDKRVFHALWNVLSVDSIGGISVEAKVKTAAMLISRSISKLEVATIAGQIPAGWNDGRRRDFSVHFADDIPVICAPMRIKYARTWASMRLPMAVIFDPAYSKPGWTERQIRWSVVWQNGVLMPEGLVGELNEIEGAKCKMSSEKLMSHGMHWPLGEWKTSSVKREGFGSSLTLYEVVQAVQQHVNHSMLLGQREPAAS